MLLNTDLILLQREVKIYDAGPKPPWQTSHRGSAAESPSRMPSAILQCPFQLSAFFTSQSNCCLIVCFDGMYNNIFLCAVQITILVPVSQWTFITTLLCNENHNQDVELLHQLPQIHTSLCRYFWPLTITHLFPLPQQFWHFQAVGFVHNSTFIFIFSLVSLLYQMWVLFIWVVIHIKYLFLSIFVPIMSESQLIAVVAGEGCLDGFQFGMITNKATFRYTFIFCDDEYFYYC